VASATAFCSSCRLRIATEDQSVLTLSLPDARAAQRQILAAFGIARDRSPTLAAGSSAPAAKADDAIPSGTHAKGQARR